MGYEWDFPIVFANLPVLMAGVRMTLVLWCLCLVLGLALGLALAFARIARRRWVSGAALAWVEVFRNTPVLIQLIWFYYAFPIVLGIQMTPFVAAVLGLTLNTSAYAAEIFRGGILSIAREQWEGALALGMSRRAAMRRIILPQAIKRMLPALTNRAIELAKVTSLASILTVHELMYQGRLLSATYYRPLEILTVVALVYFIVIWPGSLLAARLERRFARGD